MKKFKVTFEVSAESAAVLEEVLKSTFENISPDLKYLGECNEDGRGLHTITPPPKLFGTLVWFNFYSAYEGSHPERGYTDIELKLAIPPEVLKPEWFEMWPNNEVQTCHFSSGVPNTKGWNWLQNLPLDKGVLLLSARSGEWLPLTEEDRELD